MAITREEAKAQIRANIACGGPAFPLEDKAGWYYGMSLRDYFAAHAMNGYLTEDVFDDEDIAEKSYTIADAMLAERAKAEGRAE